MVPSEPLSGTTTAATYYMPESVTGDLTVVCPPIRREYFI